MKDDPITVRVTSGAREAWMYRNPRSLVVVVEVESPDGRIRTGTVRIMRNQIDQWIAEADKK